MTSFQPRGRANLDGAVAQGCRRAPPRGRGALAAIAIVAAAALTGCFSDPAGEMLDPGGIQPTLQSIQENVFTPTCAVSNCHTQPDPQMGLDLSAGQAHANLVGVTSAEVPARNRVTAHDAAESYLFMKITGDPRILGDRMPLIGSPLTAEEIRAIRDWIDAGAADN